jgi:hypothetical protein
MLLYSMKKALNLLPLLFIHFLSFSQNYRVSVSETVKAENDRGNFRPCGDGYISTTVTQNKMQLAYTFKLSKIRFGLTLTKFDHALKVLKEAPLSNGERAYGPLPPMLLYLGGRLCLIYSQFGSADENSNLIIMAATVDTTTLMLQDARELFVFEQKNYGLFKAEDFLTRHYLIVKGSPDGSKWVAVWNSGMDNEIRVNVMSKNLQSLWTKKERLNNTETVKLYDCCLDNAGSVYLSYNAQPDKNTMEGHILVLREKGDVINRQLRMTEGYPFEVRLAPSPGEPFINVLGTYVGAGWLSGVYSTRLSTSSFAMDAVKITPAPEPVLEAFKKDSWASTTRKYHGFEPIIAMRAHPHADESIDLIGEFSRINDAGKTAFFVGGDILWVHFAGGQVSFNRIPRVRVSKTPYGEGYNTVPWKGGTLVLYNDDEHNLKKDLADEPSKSDNYKDLMLVGAVLTPEGTLKREKVIKLDDDKYLVLPEVIESISPSSFIARIFRVNTYLGPTSDFKLATVTIE